MKWINAFKIKFREWTHSISIQKKIAYTFSLFFILLSLTQAQTYSMYLSHVVNNNANDFILQTIKQGSGKIDTYIDSLKIISKNIISNTVIRDIMVQHSSVFENSPAELSYNEKMILNEELSKLTLAYDNINSIQIYTSAFTFSYNFVGEFEDYSDVVNIREGEKIKNSSGELLLISPRKDYIDKISGEKGFVFSAVRKMIDYQTGMELGYVFVNVSENAIHQIISDITIVDNGTVLVFDNDGYIISSMNREEMGEALQEYYLQQMEALGDEGYFFISENHTDYIVVYHKSEETGCGMLTQIPVSEVSSGLNQLQLINVLISLSGIFCSVFISWRLSRGLTNPLKKLVASMEQVGNGDLSVRIPVKSKDEIGHLGLVFNHMTDELQELIEQYYHEQLSHKEAELTAIRAQINPHFLYNTLDTIYWMLVLKGENDISGLVVSLSEILRYSISKHSESDMVPAKADLNILAHYLAIQKARFGDKLQWETQVEPEVYQCLIPKMMLQPLVENSINHGMRPSGETLHIRLYGRVQGQEIIFTVKDDGIGMDNARIYEILNEKLDRQSNRHTGFGVSGVNRRIKILFGESYGISIQSEPGAGTSVTMTLKKELETEDRHENSTSR